MLFISDSALTIHGLTRTSVANDGDAYTVVTSPEIMLDDLDTSGMKTLTAAEQAAGLSGSFMGADGTYKCPTGTCTAAPINTGGVTLAGDWTFTPVVRKRWYRRGMPTICNSAGGSGRTTMTVLPMPVRSME